MILRGVVGLRFVLKGKRITALAAPFFPQGCQALEEGALRQAVVNRVCGPRGLGKLRLMPKNVHDTKHLIPWEFR